MFLRWLVTQAAEGTAVTKDGKRLSEEACKVARGILLVEGEKEMKSRTMKNPFSLHREPAVQGCAGRTSEQVQDKSGCFQEHWG